MLPHILPYQFPIFIRIAVNTTMTACIIRSNIAAKKTPTAIPLRLLPCRNPNLHSDSVFQNFPRHASGDIDPELTKMSPLAAGTRIDENSATPQDAPASAVDSLYKRPDSPPRQESAEIV